MRRRATPWTRLAPLLFTLLPGLGTLRWEMEKGRGIKRILQTVNVLLTTGPSIPNVNLTNGDKETALHCAAQVKTFDGHLLLLEVIMEKVKVEK